VSGHPYSPQLRTGVLLTGTGTAGAYHAGALRAIVEGGIKIDVIAAHGAGVLTALATAVDGGPRVWDAAGPWTDHRLRKAYRFRLSLRLAFGGLLAAVFLLLTPALVLIAAGLTYVVATFAALVGLTSVSIEAVDVYRQFNGWLFAPPVLPTIVPRLVVLAVLVVAAVLATAAGHALRRDWSRRRAKGAFWWRLLASPLDATEPAATSLEAIWQLVRGASNEPRPGLVEVGRRYVDVLADNFGQPGFHEVLVAVHDLDARRDLVGGVLKASSRAAFERSPDDEPTLREADAIDLTGPHRELVAGFLTAASALPLATEPALIEFPALGYWRGERHRVCDRPELAVRLVDELTNLGVEQVIIISAAPRPAEPHTMRARPIDVRGRVGELVRSMETAVLADALEVARRRCQRAFVVRPDHNPVGPFDFGGTYDEASDRRRTMSELIELGHDDAYRIVIESGGGD
jgi:hypothetical protein